MEVTDSRVIPSPVRIQALPARVKMTKRSSLLRQKLFTAVKSFIVQVPESNPIKLFNGRNFTNFRNKLERKSLASLSNLV